MRWIVVTLALLMLPLTGCGNETEDGPSGPSGGPAAGQPAVEGNAGLVKAYDRSLDFLRAAAPEANFQDPGLTALAAGAFLRRPGGMRETDREFVDGMLEFVTGFQKENGGIYDKGLANYTTCAAVMALSEAGGGKHSEAISRAAGFIKTLQTETGGIGYSDKNPGDADLSNTQFALDALKSAGIEKESPVHSKALQFLMKVQNRSESNNMRYELDDGRIVSSLDDGGAIYKPTESKAGFETRPDGRLGFRSYGSMTYALLKCYLLAGLEKDDPRVSDTVKWVRTHYTLEENPGFESAEDPMAGQQGLFYYYFTMAKALDLLGEDDVEDVDGLSHDWKKELAGKLLSMQREDGSWLNEKADRWLEGNPVLASSYALVALSYCAR